MIYLLSQMFLALCVAAIMGAAIGWVIHRTTHNKQEHHLKQHIARQTSRLEQAQFDMSLLTEDFDELQRESRERIGELEQENSQLPELATNLEKSQLLVKQMMQRHEGTIRELTKDNQKLSKKLSKLEAQGNVKSELAAKLDERRSGFSQNADSSEKSEEELPKISRFASAEAEDDPFDEVIEVGHELQQELDEVAAPLSSNNSQAKNTVEDSTAAHATNMRVSDEPSNTFSDSEALSDNSEVDDLDSVFELDDIPDLTNPFNSTDADDVSIEPISDQSAIADVPTTPGISPVSQPASPPLQSTDSEPPVAQAATSGTLSEPAGSETSDTNLPKPHNTPRRGGWASRPVSDIDVQSGGDTDIGSKTEPDQNVENDLATDGSHDSARLFEPVTQQDDLQQIFGIGPQTEKALNEMGITSYSQLATLERAEIQHIADALEIGSARIERDDWVGNARRQLEEVLEQL